MHVDPINHKSTSSLGERIDYKNMKVLSIKEFHEEKKNYEPFGR
jgi:hypothetical protein